MHRSRRRHFWILVDFEIAQNVRAACQSEHQPLFAISWKKMIRAFFFSEFSLLLSFREI